MKKIVVEELKEGDIITWGILLGKGNKYPTNPCGWFQEKGKIFKVGNRLMVSCRGVPDEPVFELNDYILEHGKMWD